MASCNHLKLITFPWDEIDEPLVLTSWGRIQRFEQYDSNQIKCFVRRNRNQAPAATAG